MSPYVLHGYLERSAADHPDRIAAVDRGRTITYRDLERAANRLAHLLIGRGVARGDRVGLYLEKSLEAVVAAYAAMKAGAAYVPLDPQAPVARVGFMAGDCGLRVLVSDRGRKETWGRLTAAGARLDTIVSVDDPDADRGSAPASTEVLGEADAARHDEGRPDVPVIDRDLAYILYTSGSTGEPKGVMLTHRAAMTFVDWAADLVGVGPEDRLSSHAPLHFDLSVFDLYAAARGGASVVLVPPEATALPRQLRSFIERAGITVWYSVPSALSALAVRSGLERGEFPRLRTVIFAGEVFPTKFLRRLMDLLPHAEFFNWYGPTETNVCTWHRVGPIPEGSDEPVPIGRAITNMECFAMTDQGTVAEPSEAGELHVRGAAVMRGYWGDRERTTRALVPDPRGGLGDPVYRTGDLVRQEVDGTYRFLGRRDAQVKSRGYRIELGEVEAALLAHPLVVEAVVTAVPDELVTNRLRAHVTGGGVTAAELARFCRERLPRYMVPEDFRVVDSLPRTSTGKVDRRALRET